MELRRHGGPTHRLDSRESGSERFFNLGRGHVRALAPGDETTITVADPEAVRWDQSGLLEYEPTGSACEVEYVDPTGNRFLTRHEIGRSLTLSVMTPDAGWQPLGQGFSLDVSTGRLVLGGRSRGLR